MTDCIFDVLDTDLDTVVDWVTAQNDDWPLQRRLMAWIWVAGYDLDPDCPVDHQVLVVFHQAVAARIIDRALASAGWTFDQLDTDSSGAVVA